MRTRRVGTLVAVAVLSLARAASAFVPSTRARSRALSTGATAGYSCGSSAQSARGRGRGGCGCTMKLLDRFKDQNIQRIESKAEWDEVRRQCSRLPLSTLPPPSAPPRLPAKKGDGHGLSRRRRRHRRRRHHQRHHRHHHHHHSAAPRGPRGQDRGRKVFWGPLSSNSPRPSPLVARRFLLSHFSSPDSDPGLDPYRHAHVHLTPTLSRLPSPSPSPSPSLRHARRWHPNSRKRRISTLTRK